MSDTSTYTTDVLVIGAGTAGAVVAARLSEDPIREVLLLEAGPDYRSADTPKGIASSRHGDPLGDPAYIWPSLHAVRTAGQEPDIYFRGRGVGGTSAVNGQKVMRPKPADFAAWAALGIEGWSWEEVLPTFVALEDDIEFGDAPYHGRGGPIRIQRDGVERWGAVDVAIRDAAMALGHEWSPDCNAPAATGAIHMATACNGESRVSTNDSHLEPARGRSNLRILGDSVVDTLLFDGTRCRGARFERDGQTFVVEAGRVVVCAGAIHSPALLLRSGIGPADELRALGVDVVAELPVGRNLLDHPVAGIVVGIGDDRIVRDARHTNCRVRYSSGDAEASPDDMLLIGLNFLLNEDWGRSLGMVGASVFEPFSSGTVRLASRDPGADPTVELQLLSDPRDLRRMKDGVRRVLEMLHQPAMRSTFDYSLFGKLAQPVELLADDDVLESWLLGECNDGAHAAGTCRMGRPDDPCAVVDADCRVLGVEDLLVVDASVMPTLPRANPNMTILMIAERVASGLRQA